MEVVTGDLCEINDAEHDSDGKCIPCLKAKTTCAPIPKTTTTENPRVLHQIFSDVCGPMSMRGVPRDRYFLMFIDGYSHYIKIVTIQTKDEVEKCMRHLIEWAEVEMGERLIFCKQMEVGNMHRKVSRSA